jgi:hypothetical protein
MTQEDTFMKRIPNFITLGLLAMLVVGLTACEPTPETDDDMAATAEAGEAGEWVSLTDGETFANWRGFQQDGVPSRWEIDEGAFYFNPEADGEGGDLITVDTYDDFEMTWEWKIGECGNSGVIYRVAESDEYNATYQTGPEYQVLDNTCHPDAQNGPDRYAAANYALHPPSYASDENETVTRPAGEWNESRLLIDDGHVEHWLNGTMVVEYELGSDEWQELVAASKFDAMPGYGSQDEGHIALQDHGNPVWYRNIRIRDL